VTRTVVRAGGACTRFALVAREALTLAGIAITDSTVGAFGISVVVTEFVGGIHPSELEWADALGAITTIEAHTHAPVIPTGAHTILSASTVTRTVVVTTTSDSSSNQYGNKS
jgi:hypothetical protein